MSINFLKLKEQFPANDIEWRVQRAGKKSEKVWAFVLAYVTNRAIMERLDDIVGPADWKNEFTPGPHGGVMCGLSLRIGEEWVTKWDGADNTDIEAVKGGISSAMKRTAVQWGVGRYLYNLDATFATVSDKGSHRDSFTDKSGGNQKVWFKWDPPALPKWALPGNATAQKESPEGNYKNQTQGLKDKLKEEPGAAKPEAIKDTITKEQWCELNTLLTENNIKSGELCSVFKVAKPSELLISDVDSINKWISEEVDKQSQDNDSSTKHAREIEAYAKKIGVSITAVKRHMKVSKLVDIPADKVEALYKWIYDQVVTEI